MRSTTARGALAAVVLAVLGHVGTAYGIIYTDAPTFDAANNHYQGGIPVTTFDGVGEVGFTAVGGGSVFNCTGTLIDPTHILTAAHCVTVLNAAGNYVPQAANSALFRLDPGSPTIASTSISVPAGWFTSNGAMDDIAVVTLSQPVMRGGQPVQGYAINKGQVAEGGQTISIVGYGYGGGGYFGQQDAFYGVKRSAENVVDIVVNNAGAPTPAYPGNVFGNITQPPRSTLLFDFDLPDGSNGALGGATLGHFFEGDTTNGDSGGPAFVLDTREDSPTVGQEVLVGVTSYGYYKGSLFGDVSVDTRVSDYSAFIAAAIPEPGTMGIVAGVGMALAMRRQRRA